MIEASNNVRVRLNTRVTGGGDAKRLEHLALENFSSESTETIPAAALFILIRAELRTGWLPGEIERDEKGFIATGQDLTRKRESPGRGPLERPPLLLETSMPSVFAAGNVRYRSVKRVASAIGEGSIAIQQIHEYLSQAQPQIRR